MGVHSAQTCDVSVTTHKPRPNCHIWGCGALGRTVPKSLLPRAVVDRGGSLGRSRVQYRGTLGSRKLSVSAATTTPKKDNAPRSRQLDLAESSSLSDLRNPSLETVVVCISDSACEMLKSLLLELVEAGTFSSAGMSTKRKEESHSKAASKPQIMETRDSRTDSERDSGFSDASSEYMSLMDITDSENSTRPVVQQGPQSSGSGSQPSQLTVVGGSYSSLSPMIIMNNVVLKQPGDNPPALKPWRFSPGVEPPLPLKKPLLDTDALRRLGRGNSLISSRRERCQRDKQQRNLSAETSTCSSPASERPLSAISQSDFTPPSVTLSNHTGDSKNQTLLHPQFTTQESSVPEENAHSDSDADTKRKRFCNTYNVLNKSGLLDITLRTKELLRQNRRTQSDLDLLKKHTDLFLQALQSGNTSVCVKLQASLQEEDGEKEREGAAQSSIKPKQDQSHSRQSRLVQPD
ncbi:hypothetical protein LDENG_00037890 [Lucifuga dentata]|nr:hypothetical protein LDENG_00037890 [Lucifuga dentata]